MGPGRHMMGGNIQKAQDTRGALRRLLAYLAPYRLGFIAVTVLTIGGTLLSLVAPYLIGVAIDQFVVVGDAAGLLRISLVLVGVYALSALASMIASWIMARISQGVLRNLRQGLFEHLQTLSLRFFDTRPTGDLMSRLTNDIDAINRALTQNVTRLITDVLTLVGIVVLMFVLNPWLALGSLVAFPIMLGLTAFVAKRTRSGFTELQRTLGTLNGTMEETISGQKVVIAFGQQAAVQARFRGLNTAVKRVSIRTMTYAMLIPPLMGILNNANIAILAGLGGYLALQGLTTVGTIATFVTYSRIFTRPLRMIADLYNNIQSALAGSERIFEILDREPELQDAPDARHLEDVAGDVVFDHVDFAYVPGVPVLRDVSLHAEPGQTIALVGPTGAGKTTIVNVLTRFYDIDAGRITIDGIDLKRIKKDDLRRQLGIVLQDVYLFSGSVLDNIRYGRLEATDEECVAAAKLANAHGFITRLPQGYATQLSERGSNLSQGQRQLLSIARAVVADPGILVLDEATSSVDTRTEQQIQAAFLRLMEGRTSFVIAHRLSTIRKADRILVINDGRIIERGTHEELLATRGFYHNLYMSQFKGTNAEHVPMPDEPATLRPAHP